MNKDEDIIPDFIAFCPECKEESFYLIVERSGAHSDENGTIHWFHGYGMCCECKYQDYYGDSD